MTKHFLILTTAAAAALGLAACNPPHPHAHGSRDSWSAPKTISVLDCPTSQGDLTRKSATADGKSCAYVSDNGAEVTLQLASLTGGDVGAVLDPISTALRAELPVLDKTATTPVNGEKDRVDIDLPGVHVHAGGNGAQIDAGGGSGGDGGGVHVDANDNGAEVHIDDRHGAGVRKMVILTSETPGPHGYRVVGYEARGPAAGPIVVATVKTKSEEHDDLFSDVRDLIHHNVGG